MEKNNRKKVYVGVSGGVDSSVALAILKNQGFNVVGVFLKVWSPDFLPCNWKEERRSAMRVCSKLSVPFKTLDCEKEYKEKIVDYMLSSYQKGETPNPDVFCNKYIKFGVFLDKAISEGADFVATGHYSIKKQKADGSFGLFKAVDKNKDQSYFLSSINKEQLSKILLPIGHLKKSEVREIAKKLDLPTFDKKDSQGLCFIGKVDMKDFLKHYIKEEKGDILNIEGKKIGEHNGIFFYTIGERIAISDFSDTKDEKPRFFVVSKNLEKNTLTVSEKDIKDKENNIYKTEIKIKNLQEITKINLDEEFDVYIRYRGEKNIGKIIKKENTLFVKFQKPEFAISPGQIIAFYKNEECFGSAEILN